MDLVQRVKNIVLAPQTEWPVIAAETTPPGALVTGYAVPLAAIGAAAGFIGQVFVGVSVPFVGTVRTPLVSGLVGAVVSVVLAVVMVYVLAAIINALAPTAEQRALISPWLLMLSGFLILTTCVAYWLMLSPTGGYRRWVERRYAAATPFHQGS